MTYPPQPQGPYGQQGPYGSQPGGGFPGGNPQQPGRQPPGPYAQQPPGQYGHGHQDSAAQFGQYAAYGAGYGQGGGFPGWPGGEPPKRKTGLIIGIGAAVLLLLGGIAGLVIWLSGDDEEPAAEGPGGRGPTSEQRSPADQVPPKPTIKPNPGHRQEDPGGSGTAAPGGTDTAQQAVDKTITAFNEIDNDTLNSIVCRSKGEGKADLDGGLRVRADGELRESGETAEQAVIGTYQGEEKKGTFVYQREGGKWCFGDLREG
ncbi:MAG: hypothetical protein ACRDQ7_14900 [Haloechinothrix sp.]